MVRRRPMRYPGYHKNREEQSEDAGNPRWFKVVKGWPTAYSTKGVWFGTSYDAAKDEWFSFHYIMP